MKLRVGVIGVGPAWESRHLPALRALSDRFEVVAICDAVQHRAEFAARQLNASVHDGFRALAGREEIDAVLLLSATFYGALPIHAACEMGKAVYCAAAIDLQDAEAVALRERVEEAGIAFMAEFPCRLSPATLRLKELLATRLGAPKLLFCNRRRSQPLKGGTGSRCYRDLVELVDWCRYVVETEPTSLMATTHQVAGQPMSVPSHGGHALDSGKAGSGQLGDEGLGQGGTGQGKAGQGKSGQGELGNGTLGNGAPGSRTSGLEQHDYFSVNLDFSPVGSNGLGPLAVISCGDYISESLRESLAYRRPADLKVVCERGIAFVDLPNTVAWFDEAGQHLETLDHERPVGEQLLIHFHRAVSSLVLKSSSLADAHRAIMIANQAKLSCESGSRAAC